MQRIFTYGTLQRGEGNHYLLADDNDLRKGDVVFVGYGRLCERHPLVIATVYHVPFLLDTTDCGEFVIGELYDVSESVLQKLDELEAHPHLYVRRLTHVHQIDRAEPESEMVDKTQAWCYFFPHKIQELLEFKPYLTRYCRETANALNRPYVETYRRPKGYATLKHVVLVDGALAYSQSQAYST